MPRAAAALLFLLALAGCSSDGSTTAETSAGATSAAAPPPDSTSTVEEPDKIGIEQVAGGFESPVQATSAPGDSTRIYVVEQTGRIMVVENGRTRDEPFVDVSDRIVAGGEQGLLSVAFHPDYAANGRAFVNYTNTSGDTRVVELAADPATAVADPATAKELLAVEQPASNHNGGQLAFGPDGLLYVGMGDGGGGGDPNGNGQNTEVQLGKLLSLDTDASGATWQMKAYGLRNPWRFSFDRETGALYIGDVGQGAWEEIDAVAWPAQNVLNFGWNVFEGTHEYAGGEPNPEGRLVKPVAEYNHDTGACSVTGGFVYRGEAMPGLSGRYFYGDYCSGEIWSFRLSKGKAVDAWMAPFTVASLTSFGEDPAGELLLVSGGGTISRLVEK